MGRKIRMSEFIHYTQFLQPVGSELSPTNTRGDIALTYTAHFNAYVKIESLNGGELFRAQQVQANLTHRITMQVDSRITHRHKFTWNNRTFSIGPAVGEDNERGFFVSFYAAEVRG